MKDFAGVELQVGDWCAASTNRTAHQLMLLRVEKICGKTIKMSHYLNKSMICYYYPGALIKVDEKLVLAKTMVNKE